MIKVVKIKTRLGFMDRLQWRRASRGFEATDREAVKLGQDLAPMDRGNGEERARSRIDGSTRSCDDMDWIISFMNVSMHRLHWCIRGWREDRDEMEMRKAKV